MFRFVVWFLLVRASADFSDLLSADDSCTNADSSCSFSALQNRVRKTQSGAPYDALLAENFCQVYYRGELDCEVLRSLVKANHSRTLPTLELGDPSKPAMYFLHGWPDNAALWANQFEVFCAPPHGKFYCVAPTWYNFHPQLPTASDELLHWDKQIDAFYAVAQEVGIKDVILVMHDFGASIGYQFVYRYPSLVRRLISMDIGNSPMPRGFVMPNDISKLSEYQQVNIKAYLTKNDTLMRENSRKHHSPCAECAMIQARIGWPYYEFIRTGNNDFHTRLAPGIEPDEWKFLWTPDFPTHIPMLFLYGRCQTGTGCAGCPVETCKRRKYFFFSSYFLDWVYARPGHSDVVEVDTAGHWVPARGNGVPHGNVPNIKSTRRLAGFRALSRHLKGFEFRSSSVNRMHVDHTKKVNVAISSWLDQNEIA